MQHTAECLAILTMYAVYCRLSCEQLPFCQQGSCVSTGVGTCATGITDEQDEP